MRVRGGGTPYPGLGPIDAPPGGVMRYGMCQDTSVPGRLKPFGVYKCRTIVITMSQAASSIAGNSMLRIRRTAISRWMRRSGPFRSGSFVPGSGEPLAGPTACRRRSGTRAQLADPRVAAWSPRDRPDEARGGR
jgi:hypothetical protein